MGKELELKLLIDNKETVNQILEDKDLNALGEITIVSMYGDYYDTRELDLLNNNIVVRIRKENGDYIGTLKRRNKEINEGLFLRDEWNVPLIKNELRLELFAEMKDVLLDLTKNKELINIVTTDFIRRKMDIEYQGTLLELAIDQGKIKVGSKELVISEIEIELKEGDPEAILRFKEEYLSKYPLTPGEKSKFQRGVELYLEGRKK